MKNSEFIWIKGQLKFALIYSLLMHLVTVFIIGSVTWLLLTLSLPLVEIEIPIKQTPIALYIEIIGILFIMIWPFILGTYWLQVNKLKEFWQQDMDKEKAIYELGLLPKGDIIM